MAWNVFRFGLRSVQEAAFYEFPWKCKLNSFRATNYYRGRCTIYTSAVINKRRKTAEERKMPKMIQYAPKAKNKTDNVVGIWRNMTVSELASVLKKDLDHVFEVMLYVKDSSDYSTPNSVIDNMDVIKEVIKKSGFKFKYVKKPGTEEEIEEEDLDAVKRPPADPSKLKPRSAVVTVMGHVDHGKTTLLDSLRNTSVVESEFGGITQHIGAFIVKLKSGDRITFLDTPGHAAFSAMRARGAHATDIVVLVVAADDGVMEQTVESIRMAREANVPIIVAINKIDKPEADINRTKQMLVEKGIQIEDFGGDVQAVCISALKKTNLDLLSETIVLQAEIMHLKADPTGFVEGVVIESKTDVYRGKLSTAVIQRGTLRKGSVLVAGHAWAKVRAMFDHEGKTMIEAPPSTPVEILGWRELPSAGDEILEVEGEKRAQEVLRFRKKKKYEEKQKEDLVAINEKMLAHNEQYRARLELKRKLGRFKLRPDGPRQKQIQWDDGKPKVSVIVKGDVDGSVEAILDVLDTYDSDDQCQLDIIHYGVGDISENDLELAEIFNAVVYGFNVQCSQKLLQIAKSKKIPYKAHNIIYKLIDDLKEEINKQLPSKQKEEILGEANVAQQFIINEGKKKIPVAGSRCTKGVLMKNALYRLVRANEIIHEGRLESMRHLKSEVNSIKKDVECGLRLEDQSVEFKPGDILICYKMVDVPQQTEWNPGF